MAGGVGWAPGGYLTLVTLIDAYESAFVYDWRTRFGLPLTALVTGEQSLAEAWLLTLELLRDPGSHVYAAVAGWPHTWTREAFLLADLFDLTARVHTAPSQRPRLADYPRPTDTESAGTENARTGSTGNGSWGRTDRPQADVRAALAQRGHDIPQAR